MTNKDFFDEDFYKFMVQDYEDIRRRRKLIKGRPSPEELVLINVEKSFESFYRKFLS